MFDQQKSVRHLEEQVKRVLSERFPSERGVGPADNRTVYTMDVKDVSFVHPDTSYTKQAEMFNEDGTFESVVKGTVVVTKEGKPLHTFKNITLGVVPYPTDRGSYIINGNEKVFLHQMLRRPGIYALPTKFRSGEKTAEEVIGEIRAKRGNYQLTVDKKDGTLKATKLRFEYNIKGQGTVDGISFLHLLGATDADIQKACGDDEIGKEIYKTFMAKSKPMSVQDIHEKTHQRPFESDEVTIQRITSLLGEQKFDAHSQRINEISTGIKVDHVGKEAFLAALKAMVVEIHPDKQNPSLDDPRYKTVLTPEAVIARSVDKGIGEWLQSVSKKLVGVRYTNDATQEKNAFRPTDAISKEVRKTYSSSLSEAIDGGNPLDLHQKLRKVTSLGDFGLTRQSVVNSNRNLLPGMFGKVDPVETPQSGSMGVVEYLARDAEIKDGLIHSKFYRVKNRIADTAKTIDDIDPLDEDKEYIAFNDPTIYKVSGKRWELKEGKVRARHDNQFVEVDSKLITLIDRTPTSHLSYAVSAIPFAQNNDGPRLLMGASMQKQALPIVGAEAPLVQSLAGTDDRTADRELADNVSKNLRSPVDGTVTKVTEKQLVVTDGEGKDHALERLNYFSTGKNSGFINHQVVVKVGDVVEKGDLLADGWHSKNGEFALGKNVTVAFMPFKGLNFEDSVVISESTANALASEEVKVLTIDINEDQIAYGQPFASGKTVYTIDGLLQKEAKVTKEQASKLDVRGIIKKGQTFHVGDVLVARYKNSDDIAETELRLRKRSKEGRFLFNPYRATGYQKGKVIDVHVKKLDEGHRVTLRFLTYKPMVKGDKLSGRHGNKGTISQVIPDAEMPYIAGTKEHVGLIFSPLAVPSRNNPGQLFEVNAGMLARKKGLDKYVVRSFDKRERQRLYDEMEKEGMANGEYQLVDPDTGKPYENKTTVGPMYIMKLKHKTEMKLTRRATDISGRTIDYMTNMPKKISGSIDGERMGPQAIGGMEFWSLTSAGAVHNIHEMTTIKSDGIERERGRLDLFNAIASGKPLPSPVTPTTLKNLQDYLYAAGIRMNPMNGDQETTLDDHFTSLMLSPNKAKDAAFDGLPEVYSSKLDRATFRIDPKELKRAKGKDDEKEGRGRKLEQNVRGGLYDEEIFGEDKEKWGKITLSTPIANPIFLKDNNAYDALLYDKGVKGRDLKRLAKGEAYYVFDPKGVPGVSPGDVLSGKEVDDLVLDHEKLFDVATGGAALERLLKDTDLRKTLDHIREDIKSEKKIEERSKLVNLSRIVSHAVDKNYEPTDYLLRTVPVLPYKYRPKIEGRDSVSHDDLTQLYQKVIEENLSYGKRYAGWVREQGKHDINRDERKQAIVKADAIPQFVVHEAQSDSARALYKRVEDLVGTKSPKDSGIQTGPRKSEEDLRGILDRLASKKGFLRDKMQKKNQDYSARSVIVSDPNLNIDEVALPEDMVKVSFEPQILNELRKLGIENRPEARKHIAKGDSIYREAVKRVFKETPVVLNRAPSLHKHSTQGFIVSKIYWNGENDESKAIGLNPIVTTGFNADFDGDQMAVHIPLSAAAKQEVFDRLMPSKNLINPTNGSMIAELKHEMSLGIYYSTRDRMPTGKNVTFKDFKALEAAYNKAEISTYQSVTMMVPGLGSVRSTAGKHLFNLALVDARVPRKFIDYKKNVNMDAKKVRKLLEMVNAEKQGGGPFVTSQAINNLRRIGFKTATTSGMSISLKDFDNITRIDKHRMLSDAKDDATFQKNLKKNDPALFKAVYEKPVPLHVKQVEAFEQAKSNFVHAALKDMVSPSGKNILGNDNPLGIMMSSGARGNPGQYVGMGAMLGVGKDVENKTTMPVTSSMIEGLNPEEFFVRSTDARKGIFDKSIATQDPGALTRQIWFANRQTVIESKDCGDKVGVTLNLATDSRHLRGRVLLESIKMPLGAIKADGNPIDYQEFERVQQAVKSNKLEQKTVRVRSPLTCKATHGICQKCYGARPDANNDELVPIGEAVGSIAAQALGEPSQQAIMRTFHSGAGQSTTTNAFEQIKNVLELSSTAKPNTAIVARIPGRITKIDTHPFTGSVVTVDETPYKLGSLPVNPQLRVGVEVEACDSLTDPRVTHINPRDVLALQGEKAAQNYLIDTVTDAFKMGNIDDTDRRHLELTVGNMTNRAIIEDEGSTPFTMGQTVRKDALILENAKITGPSYQVSLLDSHKHKVVGKHAAREVKRMRGGGTIVKKGEVITEVLWRAMKQDGRKYVMISDAVQATYTPQVSGVQNDTKMADNNWLGNAAFRNSKSHILRGAAIGSDDQLSDPLTRQMTGLQGNFGAGYNDWAKQMNEQYAGIF